MEDILTSRLRRGTTLLRLSLRVLGIQQLVLFRCLRSPPATSIPLLVLERLILIKRIQIRPPALQRFCLTPRARKTQLWEQLHLNSTILGIKTRQLEPSRFLAIPPAPKTQPSVFRHFLATPPAPATRPPAFRRSLATPSATITRPPVIRRFLATP